MATRTLSDFRAEHNLWRKDVAELLALPESEIERLEMTGEVPGSIRQKLIAAYGLPADYFEVDIDALRAAERAAERVTPKKPFWYLFVVVLVWQILCALVIGFLDTPATIASSLGAPVTALYPVVSDLCGTVVTICSGIFLGSYLIKKSNLRGRVAEFEFLYPFMSGSVTGWLLLLLARQVQNNGTASGWFVAQVVLTFVFLFVDVVFLTFFVKATTEEASEQGRKTLRILFAVALGAKMLYYVLWFALGYHEDATALVFVSVGLRIALSLCVFYGAAFGIYRFPKLQTLFLTVLPILYFAVPAGIDAIVTLTA